MTEKEIEARNIAMSVKCGVLPLREALKMANEAECVKELCWELGVKVPEVSSDA